MQDDSDEKAASEGNKSASPREARLLAQLARARREDPGGLRQGVLTAELLAPYWSYTLRIVRWKLHGLGVAEADVEDVSARVLERMVRALANKTQFGKALKYVVLDNIDWACRDFQRQRQRRAVEALYDPDELPPARSPLGRRRSPASGRSEPVNAGNEDGPDSQGLAAQARAFGGRIEMLAGRDREIVVRRFFAAMGPGEIARELGVGRGALDTATHRALRKLADSDELSDVRNRRRRPEGDAR